jgi:hypothetical protein
MPGAAVSLADHSQVILEVKPTFRLFFQIFLDSGKAQI